MIHIIITSQNHKYRIYGERVYCSPDTINRKTCSTGHAINNDEEDRGRFTVAGRNLKLDGPTSGLNYNSSLVKRALNTNGLFYL